jgi:hypothetical protein
MKEGRAMKKLNLHLFDDPATYTVTIYKDSGISAATASADSGAAETEITLTITPATGKELEDIIVLAGGVTVNKTTKKFTIGTANVVLYVTSKANNLYKVTEECKVCVNDAWTILHKNVIVERTPAGGIKGVACDGTAITVNAGIQNLIDQGYLVKM